MPNVFHVSKTLQLNDVSLAYQDMGQGDPVVLVHGGVSDLRTWTHQIPALTGKYRTIAYSRRYALPNTKIKEGANDPIDPHVDDLARLIHMLEVGPAHIVGHSWGGLIVFLLAMQRPELFRSMTLIEPPALTLFVDVPPKISQVLLLLLRAPKTAVAILKLGALVMGPAEKAFRRGDDKAAIELFGKGVLGPERFAQLSPERYAQVWDNRATDKAQMIGHAFPPLDRAEISRIQVPTLLLIGSESPAAFRRLGFALHDLLPHAELKIVDGASHIVHEDMPERTNFLLLDFFNKQ
ncbi:MAG: alpha/beta hydrolase [Paracoccaceae bacterium]